MNNYSLLSHNTFGMNVRAKRFFEYKSVEELQQLIKSVPIDEPLLHIGGGSNLLFTGDYEGTILHSAIKGIEVVDETDDNILVRVGAGVVSVMSSGRVPRFLMNSSPLRNTRTSRPS